MGISNFGAKSKAIFHQNTAFLGGTSTYSRSQLLGPDGDDCLVSKVVCCFKTKPDVKKVYGLLNLLFLGCHFEARLGPRFFCVISCPLTLRRHDLLYLTAPNFAPAAWIKTTNDRRHQPSWNHNSWWPPKSNHTPETTQKHNTERSSLDMYTMRGISVFPILGWNSDGAKFENPNGWIHKYIYTYSYYRIACLYTHYYIILYWDFTWYTLCFTRLYQTYFMILALHYVALQHVELYYTMSHHVPAYYLILYSIILLQFILH